MYRKGVSALIMNKKGEFLLVNLTSFKEEFFAIPGGGIENNETLEQAMYREIHEELGIEKESLVLVGQSDIPVTVTFKEISLNREGKEYRGFERYFFAFIFVGNIHEITINKDEVSSYQWASLENLKDYLLFENQLVETREKIRELFSI